MADIDRIIQVVISRQTTTPSMASFSGLLLAAEFLKSYPTVPFGANERVRTYASAAEVLAAGFASTHIVYLMAQAVFAQNPSIDKVYVGRKSTSTDGTETWTDALTAMALENSGWYGVAIDDRTQAGQIVAAAWVETNKKLAVFSSSDADFVNSAYSAGTPLDIASAIKAASYERSAAVYHSKADGSATDPCIDAAWLGKMFAIAASPGKIPGGATWAFKTLAGVPVDTLTPAQITKAVTDKRGNIYTSISDVNLTQYGTVGSGEYLDIMYGLDWLTARIQQSMFTPIVQQDKVPFTDPGIITEEGQLKAALQEGVDGNLLSSYTTTVPKAANVLSVNKAARLLPNMQFLGNLSGAIHKAQVAGTVVL